MKILRVIATILLVFGGLNWGLCVFDINLVNMLFGFLPVLENTVYLLVAVSAVIVLIDLINKEAK